MKLLTRDGYEITGWGMSLYPRGPQEPYVRIVQPLINNDGKPRKGSVPSETIYLEAHKDED